MEFGDVWEHITTPAKGDIADSAIWKPPHPPLRLHIFMMDSLHMTSQGCWGSPRLRAQRALGIFLGVHIVNHSQVRTQMENTAFANPTLHFDETLITVEVWKRSRIDAFGHISMSDFQRGHSDFLC